MPVISPAEARWTEADITVVFVTYNSGGVIARAVASVPPSAPVIVVDNGSPEGTGWRDALVRPVDLVAMGRNAGFGTACNAGARRARTRFVLFLNPDAALAEGALAALLDAAGRYGPGLLMPAILDETGRPMRKEGSILEPVARGRRLKAEEIAGDYCTRFVHGAAFLVDRDLFLELGGFDEGIFLYHEDDDLAVRALARRIPIICVAEAKVVHAGGKSSTPSLRSTFAVNRFKKHSELYVRRKYGRPDSAMVDALKLAGGCALALLTFDLHRAAIRAGKLAGLFDMRGHTGATPRP